MKILGLTGSIGMGKSTAAAMLRRMGRPLYDADRAVHRLLARGGEAVGDVDRAFPGTRSGDGIDRRELGKRVFGEPAELRRLENILHPLLRQEERRFLQSCRARRRPLAMLDIPLLFETGRAARCDAVIVLTAPKFLQDLRVMKRPDMSPQRLQQIKALQMPDDEKRKRADYVVQTGLGPRHTWTALGRILRRLRQR